MKIGKTNGLYWNADTGCFGPVQAATEYENIADLPVHIEDNNGSKLELDDGRYYSDYDAVIAVVNDYNAVASVVR